jgi:enoyl-CoA hydratase/carnithine racemase
MRFTIKVIPSQTGNVGKINLNNAGALHALDLDMVRAMNDILPSYANLKATIFSSSSLDDGNDDDDDNKNNNKKKKKSFCAGGDVKSIYMAGMGLSNREEDTNAKKSSQHGYGCRNLLTADFFREEYQLNYKIATQPPHMPQISIWDGIVMGGGVGISAHGKYRIATENTLFAMPETNIGFFPDVGGTYLLPRLRGGLGPYIGLTGARLKGDDLLYGGIATHYVPSNNIDAMVKEIEDRSIEEFDNSGDCAASILMSYHEDPKQHESYLARNQDVIDETFQGKESVEDIVIALEKLGPESKFGIRTLETLRKMSPTSLKVTLEGLKRGKELPNIAQCLQMEFRMSQAFMKEGSDFYEGIRAVLVDKDFDAKWEPSNLEDVSDEFVQSFFENLGEEELRFDDESTPKL